MNKRFSFLIILVILTVAMSAVTQAENIPPHLVAMASQLYKAVEKELSTGSRDKQHQKTLEESVNFLKELSVHRWSRTPPMVDGGGTAVAEKLGLDLSVEKDRDRLDEFIERKARDGTHRALRNFMKNLTDKEINERVPEIDKRINDALKKISTKYLIEDGSGRSLSMQWKPEVGRFVMKVSNDSKDGGDEFVSLFSSDVATSVDNGGKESLTIQSPTRQIQIFTASDIEEMRDKFTILGKWTDKETGEIYTFTAAEENNDKITPPYESFDKKINLHEEKIKFIEGNKIYEWKNRDTKEIIKQTKYRGLKEPFEWVGERYAMDNAEAEISWLEQQISDLIKERDGENLPPRDKQDPAGFNEVSNSKNARSITVRVNRHDGYSYTYDDGVFDGTRIRAKRTYRDVRDIENLRLPIVIRHQAIEKGWNPPGWLELDVSIDAETGDLALEGNKWALHVTYSSFMGGSPDISSIHTPFPSGRNLHKKSKSKPKLRFVREGREGFEEIGEYLVNYGGPIYLEIDFQTEQEEDSFWTVLKWDDPSSSTISQTEIQVIRTSGDATLYRSSGFDVEPWTPMADSALGILVTAPARLEPPIVIP